MSRLTQSDSNTGERVYDFDYDLAGNRQSELLSGTGVTNANRYFGYNSANQLTAEGDTLDGNGNVIADYTYEYDNNGNLRYKKDTVPTTLETHTWDRANRLLSVGNHSYAYDGNGARIQKTVSSVVTDYLLDVQRGLTQVLRESDGTNTNHYIHSPRGIHAMNDGTNWSYMLQDGLGSVRAEIAQNVAVNGSQSYAPYGEVFGVSGSFESPYGFTGEQTDDNGQVYLRARYYNPSIGVFNALDPFEGSVGRPMSLNGYSWVEGNPVMNVDPSGLCFMKEVCLKIHLPWLRCNCFDKCEPAATCDELAHYGCNDKYEARGCTEFPPPPPTTLPTLTPIPPPTIPATSLPTIPPLPTLTPVPTQSIPSSGKMYPIFGTDSTCYPSVIIRNYGQDGLSGDTHNAIDLVPSVVYENDVLNPYTNPNWKDWQATSEGSSCTQVYAATTGNLVTFNRNDGSCCDAAIQGSKQLNPNYELHYSHVELSVGHPTLGLRAGLSLPVSAGDVIGTVRDWRLEPAYSDATHIHIAVRDRRDPSITENPQQYFDPFKNAADYSG